MLNASNIHLKSYLVDETPFVEVIGRGNNKNIASLRQFLDLSRTRNANRKICLQMPKICKIRLGWKFIYMLKCSLRSKSRLLCPDDQIRQSLFKRLRRASFAKGIVRNFPKRRIGDYCFGREILMELFLHANEAKSRELKESGERLEPSIVIPIEICIIALITNRKKLHLLSFNPDYKYFADFRNQPSFITFTQLDDFLENDFPIINR